MGLFDKMRQAVGMDGVQLGLDVPVAIPRDTKVISGKLTVFASRPQSFEWVRVQLQQEEDERDTTWNDDAGNATSKTWKALSEFTMEQPFSLDAGEQREFDFQLVSDQGSGMQGVFEQLGALGEMGRVIGGLMEPRFRLEAKANVVGVVLDPSKSVRVTFE